MRFICDAMLGRLARRLRLLGFDTVYARSAIELEECRREGADRILLTRRSRNKRPCCKQQGIENNERKRVFEGEAPQALPVEGATRAPVIAQGAKRKKVPPCGKAAGNPQVDTDVKMVLIESEHVEEQLREIKGLIGPAIDKERIFRRCIECNTELVEAEKTGIESRVPEFIYHTHARFRLCPSCGRVYWEGSHTESMKRMLKELLP